MLPDDGTVLFVCTGNTCRSPMAAALYNRLAARAGRPAEARSAGLAAVEGAPASDGALRAMREVGIDLSAHRARRVTAEMVGRAREIVAMTERHRAALRAMFAPGCPVEVLAVSDPFGGGIERYRACRDELTAALCRRYGFGPGGAPPQGGSPQSGSPAGPRGGPFDGPLSGGSPADGRERCFSSAGGRPDGPRGAEGGGAPPGIGITPPDVVAPITVPPAVVPLTIVPLNEVLLPRAARLERLCFSHPWSERSLREELCNPAAFYRAALLGGRFAGYGGLRAAAGEGYIDNVAVDPACRRRGVGTALLKSFERFARRRGLAFLTLEVRLSNTAALRLYQKMGYRPAGRRRGFYEDPPEDALLMTLWLKAAPPAQRKPLGPDSPDRTG